MSWVARAYWLTQVKDVHPTCLTYVEGSAKVDGSPRELESQGPDFAKVTGNWTVYPNINPKSHTFEFSYKVGPDCDRNVTLATRLDYAGGLGSGSYPDKGPSITVRKNTSSTTLAAVANAQVGQAAALSASVTGGANGDAVEFYDGAALLGSGALNNGVATYNWTPTTRGAHTLSAKFLNTAKADTSQSTQQTVQVSQSDATSSTTLAPVSGAQVGHTNSTTVLTLGGSPNVGAAQTLSAQVTPGDAGGAVTFKDGDTVIGTSPVDANGQVSLSWTPANEGQRIITAEFSGAGTVNASADQESVAVAPGGGGAGSLGSIFGS